MDTVALSELRKTSGNQNFIEWFRRNRDNDFYISAISIGEIKSGIEKVRPKDADFAAKLDWWLRGLVSEYADNIVAFDVKEAEVWGSLVAELGRSDTDMQIAATALVNDLVVVTRNESDFLPTNVRVVNPWVCDETLN